MRRGRRRARCGAASACVVLALGVVSRVAAQIPVVTGATPVDGLVRTECRGQLIDEVILVAKPPLYRARLPDFIPSAREIEQFVRGAQSSFHSASRPDAVRPFLLLREGERCDERRRGETERLLRAQSYVADARVAVYERAPERVVLVVETVDEVAVVADVRPRARDPWLARLRLGNGNVYGMGLRAVAGFTDGDGFRHGWNAEVTKFAAFGRPVILSAAAAREPLGDEWRLEATRPFLSDFNRYAWTMSAGARDGYVGFLQRDTLPVSLPLERRFASVGAIARIGPPGELFLLGSSLTWERDRPGDTGELLRPGAITLVPTSPVNGRYVATQSARVNLLAGWRRLRFIRVAGFDAVEGLQDVRVGFEVGGTLGRGIPMLGSDDADWFSSVGISAGVGDGVRYAQAAVAWESRFDPVTQLWDASVASGRATSYWRVSANHTVVAEVDAAWGRANRTPFQLGFDQRDAGLRGFRGSREAGGARLVYRLEDRMYLGRVRNLASLAVAPFADVGRLWAGDVPYGRDTPWNASVGFAVLAAVPPASQVTWRLEVARRLNPDAWARGWEARVVVRDVGRQFWREARDVARSRPVALPTSLFTWP